MSYVKKPPVIAKKKPFHADERERDDVKQEREAFERDMKDWDSTTIIFLDESSSNCGMTPMYARSPIGLPAHATKPYKRENITMIGALGYDGIRTMMTVDGGTDGDVFYAFVAQCLIKTLKPGNSVVMDNLNVHTAPKIKTLIEGAGATLLLLPRYSPDCNPIEHCWSKLKQWIRKQKPRTRDALDDAIKAARGTVTLCDIRGWFMNSGYVLP